MKLQSEKVINNKTDNTSVLPIKKLDIESKLERRKKLQITSLLVAKYGPFVRADESTLREARHRLRVALEQTRMLREAFSTRVYEKYRVVLRPVPKRIDDTVDRIKKEPSIYYNRIIQERDSINRGKRLEASDGQKSNAGLEPGDPNALAPGERCGADHVE